MQPALSAEKKGQVGQVQGNMQTGLSAGKHASRALRGKMKLVKSVQSSERENV